MSDFYIDECVITATLLSNHISPAILNKLILDGFNFLNHSRIRKKGGKVSIIYKKNLMSKHLILDSSKLKIVNI